jgi:hypothetical protein
MMTRFDASMFLFAFFCKDEGWAMFLKNYAQKVVVLMHLS